MCIYIIKNMTANEVSISVHDHGTALDEKKRRVKCNYCTKVVSGFSRLKCHLGGICGDVSPCEEVSPDVKELMRNGFLEKKRGNFSKEVGELYHPNLPWKRNWSHQTNASNHNEMENAQTAGHGKAKRVKNDFISETSGRESVSFPKSMGSQAVLSGPENLSPRQVQKYIGRFFYETGIDLSAVKSPSFHRMMNATLVGCPMGYKIPSCQELKGWLLHDEVKEMQQYVGEIRNSWASTGCSILLDGWIDGKGRNLINILVDCPRGVIYLRSFDISAFVGDVDALQLFFDEILEEVGVENVVQIVTYSTSACMEAVGKRIMDLHRTIFWTVSASHCIELMLEKIGMMDAIRGILEKAKTITKFIHSRAAVLKLLRNHIGGSDLVKASKMRSAVPFLTLENIVSKKDNLIKMFVSSDWNTSVWASDRKSKRVAGLVADRSFWNGATMVLKATTPLVRVLELLNEGDKQQLGYIYETIDQAKETIKEEFKSRKCQYMPFWQEIDEIWNKYLHSPLHSAGYFLNPILFYSSDFFTDPEVATGLLCCIVRMAEDQRAQDLISLQVDEYRFTKGAFGEGSAFNRRTNISPACWWSAYGGQHPELQRLAIRILSQTCNGASKYELKRSLAEQLLTKGRNRVEQQRLRDLTFVHYNMQLQNMESGGSNKILLDEVDPMDDWIVDEEAPETMSRDGELTWSALDCGDTSTELGGLSGGQTSGSHPKQEPIN